MNPTPMTPALALTRSTRLATLTSLPTELLLFVLELSIEGSFFKSTQRWHQRQKLNLLCALSLVCTSFNDFATPLLYEEVTIGDHNCSSWTGVASKVDVGTLKIESPTYFINVAVVISRCKSLKQLVLLASGTSQVAIDTLADVQGGGPLSSLRIECAATTSRPDPTFNFALTSLEITNPHSSPEVVYALIRSSANHLKALTVRLINNLDLQTLERGLQPTMNSLEHLDVETDMSSAHATSTTTFLRSAHQLRFMKYPFFHLNHVEMAISDLPDECSLKEMRFGKLEMVKGLLASRSFNSSALKNLKRIRVSVGSYGVWSYPTLSKKLVEICEKKGVEVITTDPFGEDRHIAPAPAIHRAPRWTETG